MKYTIGITTFTKRFEYVTKLIEQIRSYRDNDIILTINNEYNTDFPEEYRKKILILCLKYNNIFPIFYPEQRGLAKLWNTTLIHSKHDWVLLLNDDVEINDKVFFETLDNKIENNQENLFRINGSFSHFVIHKKTIEDMNYFDERFLGFGEEDGDIIFRYIKKYNKYITEWYINGIKNLVISIRDENIKPGIGKYTKFNKQFAFGDAGPKFIKDENGILGSFGMKHSQVIKDEIQYPYEKFFRENKHKL